VRIGEMQHAAQAGIVSLEQLRERTLGLLLKSPQSHGGPRRRFTIFDSSGIAVQDLAAAAGCHEMCQPTHVARSKQRKPVLDLAKLKSIRAAIAPHIHRTPVWRSDTLSRMSGFDVFLKAEAAAEDRVIQAPRMLWSVSCMTPEHARAASSRSRQAIARRGWLTPAPSWVRRRWWSCRRRRVRSRRRPRANTARK